MNSIKKALFFSFTKPTFLILISLIFSSNGNTLFGKSIGDNQTNEISKNSVLTATNSAGTLSGNQYICISGTTTTTFSSTQPEGTWSSSNPAIAKVNATTGVITAVALGTATITYSIDVFGSANTSTRAVYVSSTYAETPAIKGANSPCQASTATYTITPAASTYNYYTWSYEGTGATIVPATDGLSANVTFSATATSGNLVVQSSNGCGKGGTQASYITISTPTVAGTLTTSLANVCSSGTYTSFTLSGYTGNILRWESSTDNFVNVVTPIVNTNNSYGVSTLTKDTYFRVVVQNGGCAVKYSNVVKITVYGAMPATGAISLNGVTGNTTYCPTTTAVFSITPVTNATSYTWVIPTGWKVISGQGTTSLTVTTGTIDQSANIEVYGTNPGCQQANQSYMFVTLKANSAAAPTVTTKQPSCSVASGTITVNTPAPATGITYTLVGTNPVVAAVTNATGVFTGLAIGTYNVTANNPAACTVTLPTTVTIALATKTWSGSWPNGIKPTTEDVVIINANYSVSTNGDLSACSVIINSGATLSIESGKSITIQNNLTVNGVLNVLDKGSLVMIDNAGTVTGSANIYRATTPYKRNDYVYWSSPVAGATIASTFTGWRLDYAFQYGTDWIYTLGAMSPGTGYIVMVPNPIAGPETTTVKFTGKVNNGVQKITGISADRSYLIGNPYPSALDADAFILANAGAINGTLSFWTHNTAIQLASNITDGSAGSGAYAYTSDDYATYNLTGGTAPAPSTKGGVTPSGLIGSGQGFFTTSNKTITGTNEIVFNNSMRMKNGKTLDNTQFFKLKLPSASKSTEITELEKNRVWLNLSNEQGAFKQTLVGYITGATNNVDNLFDGTSLDGNDYIDFYSINQDINLVIQGRALPFDKMDEVVLGYKTTVDGTFTIAIDKADGIFTNQSVFLEDKLTNTVVDLKTGDYNFTTKTGTFNDRFVLKYVDKTLGNTDFNQEPDQFFVSVKNKQIKINSSLETIDKVMIYDVSGKQIYEKNYVNTNEFLVADFASSHQVLIIKTTLQNGKIVTKKVVY